MDLSQSKFVNSLVVTTVNGLTRDKHERHGFEVSAIDTASTPLTDRPGMSVSITLTDLETGQADKYTLVVDLQDGVAYLSNGYCRVGFLYSLEVSRPRDFAD